MVISDKAIKFYLEEGGYCSLKTKKSIKTNYDIRNTKQMSPRL